jgi:putative spermidine/putrescine transport system ATP-binding protein
MRILRNGSSADSGSSVKLSVDGAGIEDFTAILDERSFFQKPVSVGEAVPLSWDAGDAIVLGRLGT